MASKTIHEAFARFFESPSRDTLRGLLKEHVGELRNCDFKEAWPEHSALAKHLLALGNAGGGCLVIGVKENADKTAEPTGLSSITDKVDVVNGLKNFLPTALLGLVEIADFKFEASEYPKLIGKVFQVVFVQPSASVPFLSQRAGTSIRAATVYTRREGGTEEANHDELQVLIDRRLKAAGITQQARDLSAHLEELKVLYGQIPKTTNDSLEALLRPTWIDLFGRGKPNTAYPKEDFDAFILRMLDLKKRQIEHLLVSGVDV